LHHLKQRAIYVTNFTNPNHGPDGKIHDRFKPTIHIFYTSGTTTVLDGLPKFVDLPKAFGGTDDQVDEKTKEKILPNELLLKRFLALIDLNCLGKTTDEHMKELEGMLDKSLNFATEAKIFDYNGTIALFHFNRKNVLYQSINSSFVKLICSGENVAFEVIQVFTVPPGALFPGTQYPLSNPTKPYTMLGFATIRDGKFMDFITRSDSFRKAVNVPGDYLDEKSWINQFAKKH